MFLKEKFEEIVDFFAEQNVGHECDSFIYFFHLTILGRFIQIIDDASWEGNYPGFFVSYNKVSGKKEKGARFARIFL